MQNSPVTILKNKVSLSPYIFYTAFLEELSNFYRDDNDTVIHFKLFENGDNDIYSSKYRIDPITIPLLLSILNQLRNFHKQSLELLLYNNPATIDVLEFLYKSDFFYVCGDNKNPTFPIGKNIVSYNDAYLGMFKGKEQRSEHKVRSYSLSDDNLSMILKGFDTEDDQRDYLISHYTYKIREHFEELLYDNNNTSKLQNTYIDILSELITNGVLHSKSDTFALMFVDRFKTKFSISDNGIGLKESMKNKSDLFYYTKNTLSSKLSLNYVQKLNNLPKVIIDNLLVIFETLYFSSIKSRRGLFDLMINVVLNSKGYFRLHTENCQIIISNRMAIELQELSDYRDNIVQIHDKQMLGLIDGNTYEERIIDFSKKLEESFIRFFNIAVDKYHNDIQYSSLRFFNVKFRGVHIEVEIPNT